MLIILVTGVNNISNVSQGNNCTLNVSEGNNYTLLMFLKACSHYESNAHWRRINSHCLRSH